MGKERVSPPPPVQNYSADDLNLMRLVICCMHAVRAASGNHGAGDDQQTRTNWQRSEDWQAIGALEASACHVIARQTQEHNRRVQTLWCGLRASSLRKLRDHVARGDVWATAPCMKRLSSLDWAVIDLLLLCDTPISLVSYQQRGCVALQRTLEFVQRFQLESGTGDTSPDKWSLAAEWYSTKGVKMSAVALQRRWHELKEAVRQRACALSADDSPLLQTVSIHNAIISKYPHVVDTSELPTWRELVAAGRVAEPVPAPHPSEIVPKCARKEKTHSALIAHIKAKNDKSESQKQKAESNFSHKTPISTVANAKLAGSINKDNSNYVTSIHVITPKNMPRNNKFNSTQDKQVKQETKGKTPISTVANAKLAGSINKDKSKNVTSIHIITPKNMPRNNKFNNTKDKTVKQKTKVVKDGAYPKSNDFEAAEEIDVVNVDVRREIYDNNVDTKIVYESDEDRIIDVIGLDEDADIPNDVIKDYNKNGSKSFKKSNNINKAKRTFKNNELPVNKEKSFNTVKHDSEPENAEDLDESHLFELTSDSDETDVKPVLDFQIGSFQFQAKVYEDVNIYSETVNVNVEMSYDTNNLDSVNKIAEKLGISDLLNSDYKLRMRPVILLKRIDDQDKTPPGPLLAPLQKSQKSEKPPSKSFYEINKELLKLCKPCVVSLRRVDDKKDEKDEKTGEKVGKEGEGGSKRVQLPDMEEVRRNNRGILTAEVAPVLRQYGPARKRQRLSAPDTQSSPPARATLAAVTSTQNNLPFIAPLNLGSSSMDTPSSNTTSNLPAIDHALRKSVLTMFPTHFMPALGLYRWNLPQNVHNSIQNEVQNLNIPVNNFMSHTQNIQNWPQVTDVQNVFTVIPTTLPETQRTTRNIAQNMIPQNWPQDHTPEGHVALTRTGLNYVQRRPSMTIDGNLIAQGHQVIIQNEPSNKGSQGSKKDLSQFMAGSKPNTYLVPIHCCSTSSMNCREPLITGHQDMPCCSVQATSKQILQPSEQYSNGNKEIDGSKTSFKSSDQTGMKDNVQPDTLSTGVAAENLVTPMMRKTSIGADILDWATPSVSSSEWARGRSPESLCLLCTGLGQGWQLQGHLLVSEHLQPQANAAVWSLSPRLRLRVPDATDSPDTTAPSSIAFQNRLYQKLSDEPLAYALLLVTVDSAQECQRLMSCGAPLQLYCLRNCTLHLVLAQRLENDSFQLSGDRDIEAPLAELSRCLHRLSETSAPTPTMPTEIITPKEEPIDPTSLLEQNLLDPSLDLSASIPTASTAKVTEEFVQVILPVQTPLKPNSPAQPLLEPSVPIPTANITPKLEPNDWTTPTEQNLPSLDQSAAVPNTSTVLKTPKLEPADRLSQSKETTLQQSLLGASETPTSTVFKTPKLEQRDSTSSSKETSLKPSSMEIAEPIPSTIKTPKPEPLSRSPSPTEPNSLESSLFEDLAVPLLNATTLLKSRTPPPESECTFNPSSPIQFKTTSKLKTYARKQKNPKQTPLITPIVTPSKLPENLISLTDCVTTTLLEPSPLLTEFIEPEVDREGCVDDR